MKLVEVVRGERSDPQVIERLVKLAEEAGHFPAITPDTPGFLVNHAGRAYSTEAQRILAEGIADAEQIDRILRDGPGFRMGPFELFDLTGLDVSHAVMESVYQQFYQDPRYTPSYQAAQRVAAGLLGRKSGQGYYRYDNGQQKRAPAPAVEPVPVDRPFWLDSQDAELRRFCFHLLARRKPAGVAIVAVARKLAVRLYRMLRDQIDYDEFRRRGRDARRARGMTEALRA